MNWLGTKEVTTLFAVTLFLGPRLQAAPFEDFKFGTPGRLDVLFQGFYTAPDSNFDKSGNTFTGLPAGDFYKLTTLDLGVRGRIDTNWHVHASARYAAATAQTNLPSLPAFNKANSNFSQIEFGTDLTIPAESILLIPDLTVIVPTVSTDRSSTELAIGEGAFQAIGRLIIRLERRSYRLAGFAGINYFDKGRAMELPYGILGELTSGRWNFGADLRGYSSISNDSDLANEPTANISYFCPFDGCAKPFAAYNPALLQTDIWFRYNSSKSYSFFAAASYDVTGTNVARGWGFGAGLIFHWTPREYPSPSHSHPQMLAPEEQPQFEESIEEFPDQRNFSPTGSRSMTPDVAPNPEVKIKKSLQNELNKTEIQIDSKTKKNTEE
ncbi:MAG: hypothetical protein C5B49_01385 [Bdellovibrio sp.]|nr:MAG: hypothetical protein C5B49_01385 [Bdellovibrio sp.]